MRSQSSQRCCVAAAAALKQSGLLGATSATVHRFRFENRIFKPRSLANLRSRNRNQSRPGSSKSTDDGASGLLFFHRFPELPVPLVLGRRPLGCGAQAEGRPHLLATAAGCWKPWQRRPLQAAGATSPVYYCTTTVAVGSRNLSCANFRHFKISSRAAIDVVNISSLVLPCTVGCFSETKPSRKRTSFMSGRELLDSRRKLWRAGTMLGQRSVAACLCCGTPARNCTASELFSLELQTGAVGDSKSPYEQAAFLSHELSRDVSCFSFAMLYDFLCLWTRKLFRLGGHMALTGF